MNRYTIRPGTGCYYIFDHQKGCVVGCTEKVSDAKRIMAEMECGL